MLQEPSKPSAGRGVLRLIKLKDIFSIQYANKTTPQRVSAVEVFTEYKIQLAGDKTYQVDSIEIDNDKRVITLNFTE